MFICPIYRSQKIKSVVFWDYAGLTQEEIIEMAAQLVEVVPIMHSDYQYKFRNKELQDELNLNVYAFGFRNYDPALGRWNVVDPLVEQTGQAYIGMGNNPVNLVDPTGMAPEGWGQKKDRTIEYNADVTADNYAEMGYTAYYADNTIVSNVSINGGAAGDVFLGNKAGDYHYAKDFDYAYIKFKNIWNHRITRLITGDKLDMELGISVGGVFGASMQGGIHLILRGPHAGIYLDLFNTGALSVGAQKGGDTFLTFGKGYYTGNVSDMTLSSTVGTEFFGGADFATPIGGLTGEISYSHDFTVDGRQNRWITPSMGATWGMRANAGSAGIRYSNTRLGVGFDGKFRFANYLQSIQKPVIDPTIP